MTAWLVVIISGLITFGMRGSFLLLGDRVRLPAWTAAPLRHVAPAAFAAIAVPAVLGDDGVGSLAPPTPEVIGVVLAVAVIARTRSMPWALAVGLGAWGLLELLY